MTTCFTQITLITLILCMIGLRAVMSHMYHKSYFKTPDRPGGIRLAPTSPALKLAQYIRDEAHRFALALHRKRRADRSLK